MLTIIEPTERTHMQAHEIFSDTIDPAIRAELVERLRKYYSEPASRIAANALHRDAETMAATVRAVHDRLARIQTVEDIERLRADLDDASAEAAELQEQADIAAAAARRAANESSRLEGELSAAMKNRRHLPSIVTADIQRWGCLVADACRPEIEKTGFKITQSHGLAETDAERFQQLTAEPEQVERDKRDCPDCGTPGHQYGAAFSSREILMRCDSCKRGWSFPASNQELQEASRG